VFCVHCSDFRGVATAEDELDLQPSPYSQCMNVVQLYAEVVPPSRRHQTDGYSQASPDERQHDKTDEETSSQLKKEVTAIVIQ